MSSYRLGRGDYSFTGHPDNTPPDGRFGPVGDSVYSKQIIRASRGNNMKNNTSIGRFDVVFSEIPESSYKKGMEWDFSKKTWVDIDEKNSSRWVAANKCGLGAIYMTKPRRGKEMWLEDSVFPVVQISKEEMVLFFGLTWEDEPLEIKK